MAVAERLDRIYRLTRATGHLARFVVFGSFVTDKRKPHDVDVFLVMDDAFDAGTLPGETALVFDHATADAHFGASVFWVRRFAAFGGE
jgi:predicted nucleotidyltransferase